MALGISVAVAAHDEAEKLRGCLESVRAWADEIVVVDGGSSDDTVAVAREYTDRVLVTTNKLMLNVNKNLAIDRARGAWVLVLDPDERVTPELADEIRGVVAADGPHDGYWMARRNHELGAWVRTMGLYPNWQLRLFRNGAARFPCLHIHEMVEVRGTTGRLRGDLLHEPPQGLFEYVHKRNLYSEHRARHLHAEGARFRARRLLTRPLWAFAKAYLVRGGWRDGVRGLVICVSGAYGTFLQDAKLWQLDASADAPSARPGGLS